MGKKNLKKIKNQHQPSVNQTNSHPVKANKSFLQEEIQSIITSSKKKNNLIEVAINSKDTRILELFTRNGGKLTTKEVLENFEYIAGNDRVDILRYFIDELKLNLNKPFKFEGGNVEQNIIHIAAKYGANKCIEYLISKKYNINNFDSDGCVPLQYAMTSQGLETPKLFIQKGAKIYQGVIRSLAVVYKHDEAIKLLDTISNIGVRLTSYETYNQVTNNLNSNSLENNADEAKKLLFNSFSQKLTSLAEKAKSKESYYKLILGQEYHLLPQVIEEQQKFIDDKILQLNLLTNHNTESKEDIINNMLNILSLTVNIHKIFTFNERDKLENYIIKTLEKNKDFSEQFLYELIHFCLKLTEEKYKQANYSKSIEYAKIIEENLSKIKIFPKDIQSIIFNKLGAIYSNYDSSKALKYLSKAELLEPNDDTIEKKYNIYLDGLHDLNAAIAEAEKITDYDVKALLKINAHKKFLSPQNITAFNDLLLQYDFNKLSFNKFKNDPLKSYVYYDIQAQHYINTGQNQAAYNIYDKLLNQAATANHSGWFSDVMNSYLLSLLIQKDWVNGCKLVNKIYSQYSKILVNCDTLIKQYEFVFYTGNNQLDKSDKILENIKAEMLIGKEWINFILRAYQIKFYDTICNQNIKEKLPSYIKNIEKLYEHSLNIKLPSETIKRLFALVQEGKTIQNILDYQEQSKDKNPEDSSLEEQQTKVLNEVIIETSKSTTSNITLQEPFVRALPKESKISFKEIEKLLSAEDYITLSQHKKQLENYFKFKKAELQKQQIQGMFGVKSPISWHTDKGDFSSSSEDIVKINEENCYATIDPKLANKIDQVTYSMFTKALKKGEAARSEGADGVKYISNSLVELKISDSDTRLYTNKIYTNNGNELIVFNKMGNHEAVAKASSEYKVEYIDVYNYDNSVSITGDLI